MARIKKETGNNQIQSLTFTLEGRSPLLMHNDRLADPLSPEAQKLKSVTSKKTKTFADNLEISRIEFDGGLYLDDRGPFIPSGWILSMLRDSARLTKHGKTIERGLVTEEDGFTLRYKGPPAKNGSRRTADWLWDNGFYDRRLVGNQKNRVARTRPKFPLWRVTATILYVETIISMEKLLEILDTAQGQIGLGDYRPRFGKFSVVDNGDDDGKSDWI